LIARRNSPKKLRKNPHKFWPILGYGIPMPDCFARRLLGTVPRG